MGKRDPLRKSGLFWVDRVMVVADLVVVTAVLIATAHYVQAIYDYMSFGGIEGLFFLLFLFPYFLALCAVLLVLVLSLRSGRRVPAAAGAVVQILSPIPWLLLHRAFHAPLSWFEVAQLVCAGAGVFLLLTLPAVRPTKNGM